MLAMKVQTSLCHPFRWWDPMSVHVSHAVSIIVLLIGLALLFSCKMHLNSVQAISKAASLPKVGSNL